MTRNTLIAILTLMLLAGCASRKSTPAPSPTPAPATRAGTLAEEMAALTASYADTWQALEATLDVRIQAPFAISGQAKLQMVRDESIFMSVRKFGIEGARLWITTDSVYVQANLVNLYCAESLHDLLRGVPLTVGNLQQLLLGQAFTLDGTADLSPANDPDLPAAWLLAQQLNVAGTEALTAFVIDGATLPQTLAFFAQAGTHHAQCLWEQHRRDTPAGVIATSAAWTGKLGSRTADVSYTWQQNSIRWKASTSIPKPTYNPRKYRRVALSEILKKL